MTAALLIARRFWPIIAALAVLVALWVYGNSRERDGVQSERATWQKARAELLELRYANQHRAETKDTTRRADTERRIAPVRVKVIRYVQTAADCPDDIGRSLLNEAVAATRTTATATSSGGVQADAVPD